MKSYQYYLFDADGTLFDTVDLICTSFNHIALKYLGKIPPRAEFVATIGSPLKNQVTHFLGKNLDMDEVLDEYLRFQLSIMEEKIAVFPGVIDTLARLKDQGKKIAIVTSRRRNSLDVIMESTETDRYFDVIVSPENTAKHKPDPEPAMKAMALLEADRARTVFVGDAMYDICSGSSAGIDTVLVGWSQTRVVDLPVAPTWTIETMAELENGDGKC